eukprot:TRINITY_DN2437_c0_g1_i2.p1 TRINITY_DN2437_c0_g1~~TRINITY_DN2437_c0_g1_i2.p1  ORF type:complete len:512 (+),score=127.19 TRINITY_DN2437_c0_g1_i2:173-1708(+)
MKELFSGHKRIGDKPTVREGDRVKVATNYGWTDAKIKEIRGDVVILEPPTKTTQRSRYSYYYRNVGPLNGNKAWYYMDSSLWKRDPKGLDKEAELRRTAEQHRRQERKRRAQEAKRKSQEQQQANALRAREHEKTARVLELEELNRIRRAIKEDRAMCIRHSGESDGNAEALRRLRERKIQSGGGGSASSRREKRYNFLRDKLERKSEDTGETYQRLLERHMRRVRRAEMENSEIENGENEEQMSENFGEVEDHEEEEEILINRGRRRVVLEDDQHLKVIDERLNELRVESGPLILILGPFERAFSGEEEIQGEPIEEEQPPQKFSEEPQTFEISLESIRYYSDDNTSNELGNGHFYYHRGDDESSIYSECDYFSTRDNFSDEDDLNSDDDQFYSDYEDDFELDYKPPARSQLTEKNINRAFNAPVSINHNESLSSDLTPDALNTTTNFSAETSTETVLDEKDLLLATQRRAASITSPKKLAEFAKLEEVYKSGWIHDAEYQRRMEAILDS